MTLHSRVPPTAFELFMQKGIEPYCQSLSSSSRAEDGKLRDVNTDLLPLAYRIVKEARAAEQRKPRPQPSRGGVVGLEKYAIMKRVYSVLKEHHLEHTKVEWLGDEAGVGGSVRERGSLSKARKRNLCLSVALQLFRKEDAASKLESFVAHEILTHAIRAAADWSSPWFGQHADPSNTRGADATPTLQCVPCNSAPPTSMMMLPSIAAAEGNRQRRRRSSASRKDGTDDSKVIGGCDCGLESGGGGDDDRERSSSVRTERYGLAAVESREVAATEEGLASLNGLLFHPEDPKQRFLLSPSLLYIFAAEAKGRSFTSLFEFLEDTEPDPRSRFFHCVRAKRDTANGGGGGSGGDEKGAGAKKRSARGGSDDHEQRRGGSVEGANGRGQIYLEGCVSILQSVRTLDDAELDALFAGRVALRDASTAARLLQREVRQRRRRERGGGGGGGDEEDGEEEEEEEEEEEDENKEGDKRDVRERRRGGKEIAATQEQEERGVDLSRRPAALPNFVARSKNQYRNQLIDIGVLNGIIATKPGRAAAAAAITGGATTNEQCLYEKYFGIRAATGP